MGIKKKDYQPLDCPNYRTTEKSTTRLILCTLFIVQVLLLILWVFTLIKKSENEQIILNFEERRHLPSNMNPVFVQSSTFQKNQNERNNFRVENKRFVGHDLCTNVLQDDRFDCHPEEGVNEEKCMNRFCCWNETRLYGVPSCYYPKNYTAYKLLNVSYKKNGCVGYMLRIFPSPYPGDVKLVKVEVIYYSNHIAHIKIYDPVNKRYEPPLPEIPVVPGSKLKKILYRIRLNEEGIIVTRRDGTVLTSTPKHGGFTFADQFLQLSFKFKGKIYGLGEHQTSLRLDTNWTKYAFFARDGIPEPGENLYGSHPFYMVMERNGSSYGVFFHNSNAMDVILQPSPAITFRSIGGIFNFFIFFGPTPADVIKQFTEVVGRPFLPPYWSLGFHLSRLGYADTANIREVWGRTRAAGIPFDTQWHDIDYMERRNDFTYDKTSFAGLPDFIEEIHQAGMRYVPIIDPGISGCEAKGSYPPFDLGVKMGVFLKFANGTLFTGKVWNDRCTVFPDFSNNKTNMWWEEQIGKFHRILPFDGIWLDMNEPSNFLNGTFHGCPDNSLEYPPYKPSIRGGNLFGLTVCMSVVHSAGYHYNFHNLYGLSQVIPTFRVLQAIGKRPFIISRSTYPGSGKYAGHWSGDVTSTWEAMRGSIPKMLSFSLFGIPMMGTDICGFNGNTTVALCQRWSQLGAFYPFSRNHNSDDCIDQDPVALGEDVVKSAKKALLTRYSLLPYLYTLFYRAHTEGETVARPLFFEFRNDEHTHDIDNTFLWGCCILIAPVLEPNVTTVKLYLPRGRWYDFYTGLGVDSSGTNVTVSAPFDTIPVFIRGGSIIPTQPPASNTQLSRRNSFDLIAAFNRTLKGSGMLYWDNGETVGLKKLIKITIFHEDGVGSGLGIEESLVRGKPVGGHATCYRILQEKAIFPLRDRNYVKILYTLVEKQLIGSVKYWRYGEPLRLRSIKILGFAKPVTVVRFNHKNVHFTWNSTSLIFTVNVDHPLQRSFTMQWQ